MKIVSLQNCAVSFLIAIPILVSAQTPNIIPGQWEYQSTTRMSVGGQSMPPGEVHHQDCVRQEDLANPDLFGGEELQDCDISGMEQSRSRLRYTLSCPGPDGSPYTMTADIKLRGKTMEGTMSGDMNTPMGPMRMHMDLSGKRIGDCQT
jgi:hypothetical protein